MCGGASPRGSALQIVARRACLQRRRRTHRAGIRDLKREELLCRFPFPATEQHHLMYRYTVIHGLFVVFIHPSFLQIYCPFTTGHDLFIAYIFNLFMRNRMKLMEVAPIKLFTPFITQESTFILTNASAVRLQIVCSSFAYLN